MEGDRKLKITIDLSDITNSLKQEMDDEMTLAHDVAAKMALDLHQGLVLATPVDTGRARAGWTVDTGPQDPVIENVVPYIGVLNDGHSQQAPAGFVEAEIDKATRP